MRVYEAAGKLNMSVDEVVGLLAGKGVDVKSPIAVISQEQFDELLNSLTREPKAVSAKAPEPPETPVEKERGRLALVTPITAAKQAQELKASSEADEDEDTPPSAHTEATPKVEPVPPARELSSATMTPKSGESAKKISYTAAGISVFALLVVIALAVAAVKNAREVGALSSTVQTNQSALNDTRNALSDLKSRVDTNRRIQVRTGLSERSVTLDEMAATMPGPNGERLRRLAASLNSLTSGM
jgi:hypothetical protein